MIDSIRSRGVTTKVATETTPAPAPTTPAAAPAPASAPAPVAASSYTPVTGNVVELTDPAAATAAELLGPRLVHLDSGWTPQGQGYDADTGELLTTYYKDEGPEHEQGVLLSIQDPNDCSEHSVRLGGGPNSQGELVGAPGHGGGVSTDGRFVYVADTENIYVYRRKDIENASRDGGLGGLLGAPTVEALRVTPLPEAPPSSDLRSAGSYLTVKGGYAYVGAYSDTEDGQVGAVWRYEIDPKTGLLKEEPVAGPIQAPEQAQGIAVVDGGLLFTTGAQELIFQPMDPEGDCFAADPARQQDIGNGLIDQYAQGLNIVDGELWVTYESASYKYREGAEHPREHIQRIPLEALDLAAAGLTPEALEA